MEGQNQRPPPPSNGRPQQTPVVHPSNGAPPQPGVGVSQIQPMQGQYGRPQQTPVVHPSNGAPPQPGVGVSQIRPMQGQHPSYGNDRQWQACFVQPGGMLNNIAPPQPGVGDWPVEQRFCYQPVVVYHHPYSDSFQPAQPVFPSAELGYRQPGIILPNQPINQQWDEQLQQTSYLHIHQSAQMLQQLRSHQGLGLQTRPMEGQYPLYGRIQMPPPPGNSRPQQTPVVHPGDMLNNVATAGQSGNMSVSTVRASDGDSGIQDENSNLPLADRTSIHRPHPTPAQPVFPSAELGYRQPVFVLPNQTIYKQQDEQLQQASHMHMHQPAQMLQQLRSHQGLGQQIRPMEGQHPLYGRIQMPPPPGNSRPQQTPVVHPGDMLNNVAALQATTGQLGKMSVSTVRASDADSGIQDEDFDLPLADRIHRPHPTPVSPDGQSHEEVKKELSKPMLSDVADSVKEIHQISTASSASELFEAAPTPSDLTVAEYAANNRPLVRRYNLSTSGFAIVAKIKAANLVHKAVRYMVRACRARKCWGGEFGAKHLMLGRDGSFYLSLEPKVPWTQFYFLDDLDMLMEHLMDHLKEEATGLTAMYFLHLRRICKNPPPSIFSSDLHFEIFLDFVIHHPFFGHPMNRTDLISGAGQWLKYCSDPDIEIIRACLEAAAKNDGWDATHDWRAELDEALLLVLWKGLPPHQRWGPAKLTKSGEDQFIFCRHAIVHFLERTRLAMLVQDLEDPTSENREVVIQFTPTPLETDYMLGLRFDYFIADSIFRILLTLNANPFIRERWNAFKRSFGGPQELEDEEEEEDEEGCSGSGSKA